jgi:hypothetical protein
MAARYLSLGLIVGVIVWLGIVMFTPGPIETAKNAPAQPCSVICMDTQPITLGPFDVAIPDVAEPVIQPDAHDWPDARPI